MPSSSNRFRTRSRWLLSLSLPVFLGCSACQPVGFYEKQAFASPLMVSGSNPTLDNLFQKIYYSREATTGGIGAKAGGGCGCTN